MLLLKRFLKDRLGLTYSGNFKSNQSGYGYDIKDFREYQVGDNIKQINWKISAKHDKEIINIYNTEKVSVVDIYIDNNINVLFFKPLFEKFKKYILSLKNELDFNFRIFIFKKKEIQLIGTNFFPKISYNNSNNLDLLFNFGEFKNQNPKILISDLLFLNKILFPNNKTYFGIFPIKDIGTSYPTLNGYCNFCKDLREEYDNKIKKLQQVGLVEIIK